MSINIGCGENLAHTAFSDKTATDFVGDQSSLTTASHQSQQDQQKKSGMYIEMSYAGMSMTEGSA